MLHHLFKVVFFSILFISFAITPHKLYAAEPISRTATVIVSQNYAVGNSSPSYVLDGNPSTGWNSGGYAPQWIQIDLGQPHTINRIRLKSGQSPDGHTINIIYLGNAQAVFTLYLTLDQVTKAGEWIDIPFMSPVEGIRYINVTSTLSPSWIAWEDIEVYDTSSTVTQHLKYFGYYGVVGGLPPGYTFYFDEIGALQNSNIGIIPGVADTAKMREMLEQARSHHMQVFIGPRGLTYSGTTISSNYLAGVQSLVPLVRDYNDIVIGFYFDEMYASTGGNVGDFITVTKALHDTFPTKKILAVEADTPISGQSLPASYFTYLTDVGFDWYFTVWGGGWDHYLDTYTKLKALAPDKNFWVIPDGLATNANQAASWPAAFEQYLSLAMADNQVIGILNFIWYSLEPYEPYGITLQSVFNSSSPYYNAGFKSRQISVGKAIINHAIALPGDLNGDGHVDIFDYNLLVSKFGNPYTIFDYNNLVANFGK